MLGTTRKTKNKARAMIVMRRFSGVKRDFHSAERMAGLGRDFAVRRLGKWKPKTGYGLDPLYRPEAGFNGEYLLYFHLYISPFSWYGARKGTGGPEQKSGRCCFWEELGFGVYGGRAVRMEFVAGTAVSTSGVEW